MNPIVHVTDVKSLGGHRLYLRFEDGTSGELDFGADTWRGVFAPLKDPDYFARVEINRELGVLVWPNGADIAPETLHRWVTDQVGQVPA